MECKLYNFEKMELSIFLNHQDIHVAAICETKLASTKKFKIPNYEIYRKDRNAHGGGVMILIKNRTKHY